MTLLLGFHAHQPVGNFPWVIDEAVQRCYGPFLEVAERHPKIRFSLHISGWLLDVLDKKYRAELSRIKRMSERGQVEMIGGGDTEPVLAAIPERDRRDQLAAMNERLQRTFGVRPRGAWLTERVWESTVVPALVAGGTRFTAVDDYHFLAAGLDQRALTGYFSTEESGHRLDLFPISQSLRYAIPFTRARSVIARLEGMRPGGCAMYFDDLEKFGIWPDTYAAVYSRGWLETFFAGLEASKRLTTSTFGEFHQNNASSGLVYMPTTSYLEMNAWTLPARASRRLEEIARRAQLAGTLELDKALLRGGMWKNFLTKYPEANWMHKRVEQVSARFHRLPRTKQSAKMRGALHRAQANDAYWHGLFGGVYLPFLRRSVYANLADVEVRLDAIRPRPAVEQHDIDLDGRREIALRGGALFAALRPHEGGGLCELTHYSLRHNFADVLARHEEAYHASIRNRIRRPKLLERLTAAATRFAASNLKSIHERTPLKGRFKESDLEVDRVPRGLFIDAWRSANDSTETLAYEPVPPTLKVPRATLVGRSGDLEAIKVYRIAGSAIEVRYALKARRDMSGEFTVRLDVAMPSADGPRAWYIVDGQRRAGGLAATIRAQGVKRISLRDAVLPGALELHVSLPCRLSTAPLWTVSRSESAYEKIMQAATLTLAWPVALRAGATFDLLLILRAKRTRRSQQ